MTKKRLIIIASTAISLIAVILFYKSGLGVNFPIFNFLLLAILVSIAVFFDRINTSFILNSILLFLLSLPFILTTSIPIRITLFAAWLYFFTIVMQTLTQSNSLFAFYKYLIVPFEQMVMGVVQGFLSVSKIKLNSGSSWSIVWKILLGVIIAIPLLAVFILLLTSADLAFRQLVNRILTTELVWDVLKITIWFVLGFLLSLGFLYYNLVRKQECQDNVSKLNKTKKQSRFFIESITILSLVEVLFLVFNIIQIKYLFGGEQVISNAIFTYSEYARKGFFELVIVSIIALLLLAVLFKVKKTSTRLQEIIIRGFGILGLLELVPMAVSAFYRLYMYESTYGFTRLRVYSHLFIVYLLVLFIWFGMKFLSRLKGAMFLYGLELITIASLVIVGIGNIDSIIASLNIKRYQNADNKEIDIFYLSTLSDDALSPIVKFFDDISSDNKEEAAFYLKSRLDTILFEKQSKDLREFNFMTNRAESVLSQRNAEISRYSRQFERKSIQEYMQKYRASTETGDFWSFAPEIPDCSANEKLIKYITSDGIEKYCTAIEVFNYESYEQKEDIEPSVCTSLEKGKYFMVVREYDGFLGLAQEKEIFVVDVDSSDEIFLVSRGKVWDNFYD